MDRPFEHIISDTLTRLKLIEGEELHPYTPIKHMIKIANLYRRLLPTVSEDEHLIQELLAIYHVRLGAVLETACRFCLTKVLSKRADISSKYVSERKDKAQKLDLQMVQRLHESGITPALYVANSVSLGSLEHWNAAWEHIVSPERFFDLVDQQWGVLHTKKGSGIFTLRTSLPEWRRHLSEFYDTRHQAAHDSLLKVTCDIKSMKHRELAITFFLQSLIHLTQNIASNAEYVRPLPADDEEDRNTDKERWLPAFLTIDGFMAEATEVILDDSISS